MAHKNKKIRVNITVDLEKLERAKKKLNLFGGKLSTLFNLYLADFIESEEKALSDTNQQMAKKIAELEARLNKIENGSYAGERIRTPAGTKPHRP